MGISLMIVDDDIDDIEIFIDGAHEVDQSIRCLKAQNGLEALKLLEIVSEKPDFIFLDLNMPKLNGKDFIREIKKNPELSGINIVVYSTGNIEEEKQEVLSLGAIDYISKPTSLTDLCDEIKRVISSSYHSIPE
jgi:CheY-like chemotaxis protein